MCKHLNLHFSFICSFRAERLSQCEPDLKHKPETEKTSDVLVFETKTKTKSKTKLKLKVKTNPTLLKSIKAVYTPD